jgi:hypothetical protein
MTDQVNKEADESPTVEAAESPRKRPYEAPSCEKKRSIHRVTLLSGMGVMSVGALSMTT